MRLAATDPELFDRAQWFAATSERREQIARDLAGLLAPEFVYAGLRGYAGTDLEIAVFTHVATDARFSLIPGGSFEMGMSPEEEQAIVDARPEVSEDEDDFDQEFDLLLSEMGTMRPLHTVQVPPFLLAQRVLTVGQVRRWLDGFVDPLYGGEPEVPAHLSGEQDITILVANGLRLPSEAELEYAARGHLRRTLLPTGTRVPDEDIVESMLADREDLTSNAFGVHGYGLYPERCADAWHEHYKGAPTDGSAWPGPGPRVVRGGAANCYPWQGCGEWNVMLCAFRQSDHAAEFGAALRPARSLRPVEPDAEPVATTRETTTKKTAAKKSPKSASKTEAKSASKATAKKTASKSASKATAKRTASKAPAKKSASKTDARSASKTDAKSASKTDAKSASKAAAKKTASKASAKKTASKASAKKTASNTDAKSASKAPAKIASKASAKITSKAPAKKTASKAPAKKTASNTDARSASKASTKKPASKPRAK